MKSYKYKYQTIHLESLGRGFLDFPVFLLRQRLKMYLKHKIPKEKQRIFYTNVNTN